MFMQATLGYIIPRSELAQDDIHELELFTVIFKFFLLMFEKLKFREMQTSTNLFIWKFSKAERRLRIVNIHHVACS